MLYYSEYPIFVDAQHNLKRHGRIIRKEIADRLSQKISSRVGAIANGDHQWASSFHDLKFFVNYLSHYQDGRVSTMSISPDDYHKSNHYIYYLGALAKEQTIKIQIDRIDYYLHKFGDAVNDVSTSSCSVSTYVYLDACWFQGKSQTDLQDIILNHDYIETMPTRQQLSSRNQIKVRISDHLPGTYAMQHFASGNMSIIINTDD